MALLRIAKIANSILSWGSDNMKLKRVERVEEGW